MSSMIIRTSAFVLFIVTFIIAAFAEDSGRSIEKKRHQQWTKMMGRPIINSTSSGLRVKVWLFPQAVHKKIMSKGLGYLLMGGAKDSSGGSVGTMKGLHGEEMKIDKTVMDALMGGTHHLMIVAADAATGNEFVSPTAQIKFIAPSSKETSIDLPLVMGHFAAGITLSERGKYRFFLEVTANGFTRDKKFTYVVR
ncbi:MAG: hypothetical protein KA247_07430 [Bacteroidetes bacterium]|nr:hypothetical protein [Bacteroidota bacterium]